MDCIPARSVVRLTTDLLAVYREAANSRPKGLDSIPTASETSETLGSSPRLWAAWITSRALSTTPSSALGKALPKTYLRHLVDVGWITHGAENIGLKT